MSVEVENSSSSKLVIWSDGLNPATITTLLDLEPTSAWRKGDPVRVTNPKGREKHTAKIHSRSCWIKAVDAEAKKEPIDYQLRYWCDLLLPRESGLQKLRAQGGEAIIDCFINEGPVVFIRLSFDLLSNLGSLGINVSLALYDTARLSGSNS
jgi:hypothetical protein